MPTLIVSPPPAVGLLEAAGDAAVGSAVVFGELFVQAFRRKLVPNVAEPYTLNQ